MGGEVRVQPSELARLAQTTLEMSMNMADAWRDVQGDIHVPVSAFGRLSNAQAAGGALGSAVEDADTVVGRQVAVYEGDVDALLRVAFSYEEAEQANTNRLGGGPL